MPSLTYHKVRGGTGSLKLGKEPVRIGRSRKCAIPFPGDTNISREHAEIRLLPTGQYSVRDLDSKNGTYVNSAPVSTWVLKEGDRIQVGNSIVTYRE
jgi:pSer/pThr/pTyr-binding forkhead associated (FHA) protein